MKNKSTLFAIILLVFSSLIFAQQASNVTFSTIQTTQFTASWTNGAGTSRAAFIFLGNAGTAAPVNNTTYTANTLYGAGTQIGVTGWYCIYNGVGTSVTVTGLTAGTTYRVMVTEYTGAPGAETYNTVAAVNNPNNQITVSTTPVAASASAFSQTAFNANWGAVTGAASYQLDVATDNLFAGILVAYNNLSVAGTTQAVTGLTAGVTYYYRVRAVNAGGTSANSNVITAITVPGSPTATAATTLTASSFFANWNAVTGATGFRIDVGTTSGGTDVLNNFDVGNVVTYNVTGLLAGTNYYFQVRAYNANGTSGNSNIISTSTVVAAPVLSSVAIPTQGNNAVGISIIPTLTWLASTGANNYDYQVSTDPTFATTVLSVTAATPLFYNFTIANHLANGVQYYWRVRATSTGLLVNSTSAWSSVWNFITITPAVPYLTNPSNAGIISWGTVSFAWYSGVVGIQYNLQVTTSTDPTFATPFINVLTTNLNYNINVASYSQFVQGGTYLWRIISLTTPSSVIINYSNTWQFSLPGLPQPFASYPTGNVSIYNNPPTLYWYLNTYNSQVTQYIVRYRRSDQAYQAYPTASSNLFGTFTTASTNLFATIPFTLNAGYQYYWEVAAWDGTTTPGSLTNWSSEVSFTVYSNITFVVCYPSWPIGGATIYSNPPTLYWYTNVYAPGIQFRLEYANNAGFAGSTVVPGILTNSFSLPSALSAGHYYWHVQASFDGITWGSYSASGDFIVTSSSSSAATAPVPTPATPSSGIIVYVTNPTLNWYAYSSLPIQYQVIYATDPTLTSGVLANPVATSGWLNTNSYVVSGLIKGATYYWQVRTKFTSDPPTVTSAWSTVAFFTVSPGAAAVVPITGSPIGGTPINNTSAVLSWIVPAPSTSTLTYDVQYSKKSDFSNAITISDVNATNVTVNNLEKGTTYFWRASSKTNTGIVSNYSAAGSFKTDGSVTSVEEKGVIPTKYDLSQNYPNPFNPTTNITYALPANSYVTIRVYDMLGREVRELVNREMTSGKHSVEWRGEDNSGNKVTSGTYIYRITAGGFTATKKMVLLK